MGTRSLLIQTFSLPAGVAPDEEHGTGSQKEGPTEGSEVADVQRGGNDLHHHQDRNDGNDQPDAPAVVDGPGEDGGRLALDGHQKPGHRVDQNSDAASQSQQDECQSNQRDVDAGGPGHAPADAG